MPLPVKLVNVQPSTPSPSDKQAIPFDISSPPTSDNWTPFWFHGMVDVYVDSRVKWGLVVSLYTFNKMEPNLSRALKEDFWEGMAKEPSFGFGPGYSGPMRLEQFFIENNMNI